MPTPQSTTDANQSACRQYSILENYRAYIRGQRLFSEVSVARCGCREQVTHIHWQLDDAFGPGRTEAMQLHNGLCVGMCHYAPVRPFVMDQEGPGAALRFNLMFSGNIIVGAPGGRRETFCGGDLWVSTRGGGDLFFDHRTGPSVRGLSIEVPQHMLEAWLGNATCGLSRNLERFLGTKQTGDCFADCGLYPWRRSLRRRSPLIQAALRLSLLERCTVCGRIRFESLALDVFSQILSLDVPVQRRSTDDGYRKRAVNEALEILEQEWASPPTISSLARRVGLNECYLKSGFRKHTGLSIGEYVRKLRMEKALDFIENNRGTIMQTALFVGYSNPSHFSAAFKKYYGRSPSCFLSKK